MYISGFAGTITTTCSTRCIAAQGNDSILKRAIGNDWKGKAPPILYTLGLVAAPWATRLSLAFYVLVALIWLIPDRRIERVLVESESRERPTTLTFLLSC